MTPATPSLPHQTPLPPSPVESTDKMDPSSADQTGNANEKAVCPVVQSSPSSDLESLPTLKANLASKEDVISASDGPLSSAIIWKRRIQYAAMCWCFVLEGWNDGSTGPLLPRIQETYHVNFAVVSLLYVFSCFGFILGALLNVYIIDRYGFGKVIVAGTVIQAITYAIEIPAPPFPVWVFAFFLYGFGTALQGAQCNAFVAGLNSPSKMSIMHACYGAGALSAPFVATRFSQMKHWNYHYFTSFGLAFFTSTMLVAIFRFKRQEAILEEVKYPAREEDAQSVSNKQSKYKQMWRLKVVHLLAFFIFAYCGAEVTMGGWCVTYLINRTGGGPSSGYVASGFFGGLTAGRVLLIKVNKLIGERRAILFYATICVGLEIFLWVYPKMIPSAVAISLIGFLLGPMFPIMMNQCSSFIPHWLLVGSIGWIVSFGLVGTAVVPFMTGALSEKFGIVSLQPLLLFMIIFMSVIWGYVMICANRGEFSQPTTPALSRTQTEISK